jgi:chemotaxis protein CheY-P-specific phosphatase CheC
MSEKKRIDTILETVQSRIQEEVGALLGADFTLSVVESNVLSKADIFGSLKGKQICSKIDIAGDVNGSGCLLIGIKDGIRLGGTLIMLPESELEEFIGREDYSDEIEDSYSEITNIIVGAFTNDFEEKHPKQCRFIRKENEIVSPSKIDIEGEEPIPEQNYYAVSYDMELDTKPLGKIFMLLPAADFDLENDATDSSEPSELNDEQQGEVVSEDTTPTATTDTNPSPEKSRDNFDQLLEECQARLQKDIGELLGTTISLTELDNRVVTKKDFLEAAGTDCLVITDMEIGGDLQGIGYFILSRKDAIHLAGALTMLPPSELEGAVQREDFGEDAKDAFGEIGSIASGVYTGIFEEGFAKKINFNQKDLSEVLPNEVDIASDAPFSAEKYYVSTLSLAVEGSSLGRVQMLFPADLLGLIEENTVDDSQSRDNSGEAVAETKKEPLPPETKEDPKGNGLGKTAESFSQVDLNKHKIRVDNIFSTCMDKMQEEVGTLLGVDVKLSNIENSVVRKRDFFEEKVAAKQVVAKMDVIGDPQGHSYLSIDLKDAIRIGGVLIMLPASELNDVVSQEEFSEDTDDAYGEIANIIAGVYSAVFEEQYTRQIRFVKTELAQVTPAEIEVSSPEPFPDTSYYMSRMDFSLEGENYGKVNFLIPLEILQLEGLALTEDSVGGSTASEVSRSSETGVPNATEADRGRQDSGATATPDVLLVGDDSVEATKIEEQLAHLGYSVKFLSYSDELHNYLPGRVKAVYLVMRDVNELAFGTAIKLSSSSAIPIIAAGPAWTRSKVIKAVKYGVSDILLTPASSDDIAENVNNNLVPLAA